MPRLARQTTARVMAQSFLEETASEWSVPPRHREHRFYSRRTVLLISEEQVVRPESQIEQYEVHQRGPADERCGAYPFSPSDNQKRKAHRASQR